MRDREAIRNTVSHTPGPWEFLPGQDNQSFHPEDPIAGSVYSSLADLHVARVWSDVSVGDAEANARLIAAAPDLLTACEVALNDRMFKDWPDVATMLQNAIKKARGE